jgi:hypothetical protein
MTFDPRGYDPQAVGEHLLNERRKHLPEKSFHEIAEQIDWDDMPKLPPYSSAEQTKQQYIEDLQREAAQGIESARLVLEEHGWPLPLIMFNENDKRDEEHARATPLHTDESATFIERHPARKMNNAFAAEPEHEAPFFPESGVDGPGPFERCIAMSGATYMAMPTQCTRASGHDGYHKNSVGHTWA